MRNTHFLWSFFLYLFCNLSSVGQTQISEKALMGKGDLVLVGDTQKLQPTVQEAFLKMQKAALKDSISIQIVSAYRSYNSQKRIWNNKYNEFVNSGLTPYESILKIIEYSTLPGASRHHWGTDIDIVSGTISPTKDRLIEENFNDKGVYNKLKKWMDLHAEKYDFYLVYTNNPLRKGFKYEPWHYSYKPLAKKYLEHFSTLNLKALLNEDELKGSEFFTQEFLEKYIKENILDINPSLK